VNLAVNEGDRIRTGQFLLQIDPKTLRSRVDNSEASLQVAAVSLDQMRQSVETARVQLEQAKQTLVRQQGLWKQQLTTRAELEKAENDVKTAESSLQERDKSAMAQESRIMQERAGLDSAKYDLTKVRIESPIDGIVTRRNIQEGETAMIGTMNNAGTVLLTLADMSIIQAEVEVDETNIPNVRLGQIAKISIDAIPDKSFKGHVTEIGNSPIQAAAGSSTQATNFKVVVVLDEKVPEVRPGFTCTADITTATRQSVAAVPIPSVAVRELTYDANGQVIKAPTDSKRRRRGGSNDSALDPVASAAELKPGETRKETEGVFVVRDKSKNVEFVPIKMGIAGDKYFEILSGLAPGDQVITGPYNSVRNIADGDPVKVDNKQAQSK
jgi:HlyD family secretion protein